MDTLRRIYHASKTSTAPTPAELNTVKFGILGAANIAPNALIQPAANHPEVVIYAVAARDQKKAEAFAEKHGITKAYGGPVAYQDLVNDPEVTAVYNPLPNGLHFEWTMKALQAGKHVLLEKPSCNTAEETKQIFDYAKSQGLVVLEAFHYRFHPAIQHVKAKLKSGEFGAIKGLSCTMIIPPNIIKDGDIRWDYALGGGALMDCGSYVINVVRYLSGVEPTSIASATAEVYNPPGPKPSTPSKIDRAFTATLEFPNSTTATVKADMRPTSLLNYLPSFDVTVDCECGKIDMTNFIMPTFYHKIKVTTKSGTGDLKTSRTEKAYKFPEGKGKGEDWWTTYRYQLEAFVDKVQGRTPQTWITAEDSIGNMRCIEAVYAEIGLGSRPKSTFVLGAKPVTPETTPAEPKTTPAEPEVASPAKESNPTEITAPETKPAESKAKTSESPAPE